MVNLSFSGAWAHPSGHGGVFDEKLVKSTSPVKKTSKAGLAQARIAETDDIKDLPSNLATIKKPGGWGPAGVESFLGRTGDQAVTSFGTGGGFSI